MVFVDSMNLFAQEVTLIEVELFMPHRWTCTCSKARTDVHQVDVRRICFAENPGIMILSTEDFQLLLTIIIQINHTIHISSTIIWTFNV